MKIVLNQKVLRIAGVAMIAIILSLATETRANVYATNIKLNGSLNGVTNAPGGSVVISYILNEPATRGVAINILSGATVLDTINLPAGNPGTSKGSNSVTWGGTNSSGGALGGGTYSVSITAAATGYTNWTQISTDGSNTVAVYPRGLAVDNNTNSVYYGRVVIGCATDASAYGVTQQTGFYKANADGSPADEGTFAYAGYTTNDSGATSSGEMPSATASYYGNPDANPDVIRIGEDDRIYWADDSYSGAIIASDILGSTNQVVITSGTNGPWGPSPAFPNNPHNYGGNPQVGDLDDYGVGIQQFDVVNANKTNAAIYLADLGDYPNWGVWMYRLVNGASDTNDTVGTQTVACPSDGSGDLVVTGAGLSVDYKQDIFVSQYRVNAGDTNLRTVLYTNWNGGVLPPEGAGTNDALGISGHSPYKWGVGVNDSYMTGIYDTVVNSRSNPTLVAVSMYNGAAVAGGYNGANGGIRILSAVDGSTVVSNLDLANWYLGVAFDNVGNVYGGSTSTNYWRVWSPPGTNQASTVAVPKISITAPAPIVITGITVSGATVTIKFTASSSASPSSFQVYRSGTANGLYSPTSGVITQISPGVFQAVTSTSGAMQFYQIVLASH